MEEKKFYSVPEAPYFFQNSKRFPGKSLEDLIFSDSSAFFGLARHLHHENDSMHIHIRFLLAAGDDLETKMICPFCGKAPVKFFLLLDNHLVNKKLTCCGGQTCRQALKFGHEADNLIAFKIRNLEIKIFKTKTLRRSVESLFRQALGLKPKSSPQEIFKAIAKNFLRYFNEAQRAS